jgi:hypothetical protein
MPDEVLERVLDLVARETGRRREMLRPDIQIERDLGCSGEDAIELMEVFAKEFSVDLAGLEVRRYFSPEWTEISAWQAILILASGAGAIGLGVFVSRWSPPGWVFPLIAFCWVVAIPWIHPRSWQRKTVPLTPLDLIRVAHAGRWVPPEDH